MTTRPILIDCDPGVDDMVALLLAFAAADALQPVAVTTVAGNLPLPVTEKNARRARELAGRSEVPVYAGCPRPLLRPLATAERHHGSDGIGGVELPEPHLPLHPDHGVDAIIDACLTAPGPELTLCLLGPMTNLAVALVKVPEITAGIREVVFMGGAALSPGNVTPAAEFNVYCDPHAAEIVLGSGVPLTMIGLDLTRQARATAARRAAIAALATPAALAAAAMLEFYSGVGRPRDESDGPPLHDPCVIAYLLRPELFSGRHCHVAVDTTSEVSLGRTVADWWGVTGRTPNCRVLDRIDADGYFALLCEHLVRL